MIRGVGIDITERDRCASVVNDPILRRQFAAPEEEQALDQTDDAGAWATLFAAKEAILKALRIGLFYGSYWQDIRWVKERIVLMPRLRNFINLSPQIHVATFRCLGHVGALAVTTDQKEAAR